MSEPVSPTANEPDAGEFITTLLSPGLGEHEQLANQYRVISQLGEGGMGQVYLAQQLAPVERKVALKLIKPGLANKEVLARFDSERQALALMDHPYIATIFDAGTTSDGRPFFAMEYVEGIPITQYCDRYKLNTDERIQLLQKVCEGVQHAHHKAIIHRDLKPSNILVTVQQDTAVPKIIDFGVAKATAKRLTEKTLFTELGQLVGTPEYMSPEQAEMGNENVDTRTDVYALGVLLYELLVGAQAFESESLREAGFDEMRRTIREVDPPKPSVRLGQLGEQTQLHAENRRTDPSRLRSTIQGDLDWITMKSIQKDRTLRYGSPAELAADLDRFLKYEAVTAGPPTTSYRIGKFIRRNRLGVGIAAVFLGLLMTFAAAMTIQSQRLAEQKAQVEEEKVRAERGEEAAQAATSFLVDVMKEVLVLRASKKAEDPRALEQTIGRFKAQASETLTDPDQLVTVHQVLDQLSLQEKRTVHEAIRRWEYAWRNLDVPEINRIEPGRQLTKKELKHYRSGEVSVSGCEITVTGAVASADCEVVRRLYPSSGSDPLVEHFAGFELRRDAQDSWYISQVRPVVLTEGGEPQPPAEDPEIRNAITAWERAWEGLARREINRIHPNAKIGLRGLRKYQTVSVDVGPCNVSTEAVRATALCDVVRETLIEGVGEPKVERFRGFQLRRNRKSRWVIEDLLPAGSSASGARRIVVPE